MYMRVAKFMIPKDICASLSGHALVCAYTRIALNLMRSLDGAYPNRLREKRIICEERIEFNDLRRSSS